MFALSSYNERIYAPYGMLIYKKYTVYFSSKRPFSASKMLRIREDPSAFFLRMTCRSEIFCFTERDSVFGSVYHHIFSLCFCFPPFYILRLLSFLFKTSCSFINFMISLNNPVYLLTTWRIWGVISTQTSLTSYTSYHINVALSIQKTKLMKLRCWSFIGRCTSNDVIR